MQEPENEVEIFCYLGVKSQPEFIIQIVLTSLSLLLVGDAFRKYYKMRGTHNKHVTFVYRLLLFWWITYVISKSYSLVLFKLTVQDLSYLSKGYFFIDWINAFSIQWLLLYLPYQWAKQISLLFDPLMSERESEIEIEQVGTTYHGCQTKIYKLLKYYMTLRVGYLSLPIIFLFIDSASTNDTEKIIFKLMIYSLLLDCVVITLSLVLGMISLKTTQELREQLDEQESRRTFNQYLIFIIANLIRFIFDLKFVIIQVLDITDDTYSAPNCINSTEPKSSACSIALLVSTCLLTFYIPIFMILRIYNLQDKPGQMCESLIISKTRYATNAHV